MQRTGLFLLLFKMRLVLSYARDNKIQAAMPGTVVPLAC